MDSVETLLRETLDEKLGRRDILQRSVALGLSAPLMANLLGLCTRDGNEDDEDEDDEPPPVPRGGGGQLRLHWWQAPTVLNPHFAQGTKDFDASRPVLEPLADVLDDGTLIPVLASRIPTLENGDIAEDGTRVTWRLKEGVTWHDGEPFTADDVLFTFEWLTDEDNTPTTAGSYRNVAGIEVIDDLTAVIHFEAPTPAWMEPFVGNNGRILPKHIMEDFTGAEAAGAEFNLQPIGTGPYEVADFTPGESVEYEIYPNYHLVGKPFFDSVELRGGGDAAGAARSAVQTEDTDYAWNLQVAPDVLEQISAQAADGEIITAPGLGIERIVVNFADPTEEVDGVVSEPSTEHPFHSDDRVREAFALLCDRDTIAEDLYGPSGEPTANWLAGPAHLVSPNMSYEYDIQRAGELLDAAGWTVDDGERRKDGVTMELTFQSSTNAVRQQTQEIVKAAFASVDVRIQIKAIEAAVFFSSDPENPDTAARFAADLQMYTNRPSSPYPIAYCEEGASSEIAEQSNNWSGANYARWSNDEFDAAYRLALTELNPEFQTELFIRMNDLIVGEHAHIPLIRRNEVSAKHVNLDIGEPSRWTSDLYNIADWRWVEQE
ncbi:MAG: peptide ABC transporter substrate-binding protein [Chloroflexota bacterium]